jgi:hypothetical protein
MTKQPVTISIRLCLDSLPVGQIVFQTLLISRETDYCCQPEGILTFAEAETLAAQLRHLPAQQSGRIGHYRWEEM